MSPAKSSESILSEADLGEGTVKAAECRDSKLYVLRDTSSQGYYWWYFRAPAVDIKSPGRFILDIYDTSALPALTLLGSCSVVPPDNGQIALDHLLWPQPNRPAMVVNFQYSYWYRRGGPIVLFDAPVSTTLVNTGLVTGLVSSTKVASSLVEAAAPAKIWTSMVLPFRPYWIPDKAPRLIVFDTTDVQNPSAGEALVLGPNGTSFNDTAEAADGLVVVGSTQWKDLNSDSWYPTGVSLQTARVVEVEASGTPIVRPVVDLPGSLFAVTELDRNGFLAYTRSVGDDGTSTVVVSACDGFDAFAITSIEVPAYGEITAGGRRLFVAGDNGVERRLLTEDGFFVEEAAIELGWSPYTLRYIDGTLIGGNWRALFAADAGGSALSKWKFPTWNPGIDSVMIGSGGDLLVPFGEYGVERLSR